MIVNSTDGTGFGVQIAQNPMMIDTICSELVQLLFDTTPGAVADRVDPLANAILVFLALDQGRFWSALVSFVQQAPADVQHRLQTSCQDLFADESLQQNPLDRNTKRLFQARMRQFVSDVQSFLSRK